MNYLQIKELREEAGMSQTDLADKIGVSLRTMQNYEKGGNIREDKLQLLHKILVEKENVLIDITSNAKGATLVPLLPISAQGGTLNEFVTSVKKEDCEKIISPIKEATFAITIAGDSMAPEYPSGSQVLIKRIDEEAFIEWGRVYVLDTCNGVVVKRIIPSEHKDCIKCVSDNNALIYAPFDVRKTDIYGIYRVMLSMSIK